MKFYYLGIIGFILSLLALVIVMPFFIKLLKAKNIEQVTSEYALDEYKAKAKTPIMGGLLFIVFPVLVFVAVNCRGLFDKRILFIIFSYVLFCLVGFLDDLKVILKNDNEGLSPKTRILMELAISIILYVVFKDVLPCQVTIPFINISVQINPIIYICFMTLLFMAEANAVNFTDGMDGLCAGVSFIALLPFLIMCFIYKDNNLLILVACVLGGLLGYLFFNFHPAKIFMGDSGSLALGALFTSIALVLDKSIALFIIGGVFVIEMFCVLSQQISVRLFHKRIFSYTPIHYAFSLKGYKETKIVLGFYLFQFLLSIIGFIIGIKTL